MRNLIAYYILIITVFALQLLTIHTGSWAYILDALLSLVYIYAMDRLGVSAGYKVLVALIMVAIYSSVFILNPSSLLLEAIKVINNDEPALGSLYLLSYLIAALLPSNIFDLVNTIPYFQLCTALSILEMKTGKYALIIIVSGMAGVGASTIILSLLYNTVTVTYGLSAPTMGLMGSLITNTLRNMRRRPRYIHVVNLVVIAFMAYQSSWLVTPIPPVVRYDNVNINKLGHFISFVVGLLLGAL